MESSHPKVKVGIFSKTEELPKYATSLSSGMDLKAVVKNDVSDGVLLCPNSTKVFKTGLSVAIPVGYEMQIRSRSGLSVNHGIVVLNSPGTIDADYRGEIGVILHNTSDMTFYIKDGMKIAQAVICPVYQADLFQVKDISELNSTERGDGGFGSTGL